MTVSAYARVSTLDQSPEIQKIDLKRAYPDCVYREEKKSGTKKADREILNLLLDMITQGDKLIVWKQDRLARNMKDLVEIVDQLSDKGAALEILDQKIDTSTATGKAFLQMPGVFAEFETNLRMERQMAGIAAARAKGKHLGRKAILSDKQKQEVRVKQEGGMTPTQISKEYGVSRATIYSVLKNTEPAEKPTEVQLSLPV